MQDFLYSNRKEKLTESFINSGEVWLYAGLLYSTVKKVDRKLINSGEVMVICRTSI